MALVPHQASAVNLTGAGGSVSRSLSRYGEDLPLHLETQGLSHAQAMELGWGYGLQGGVEPRCLGSLGEEGGWGGESSGAVGEEAWTPGVSPSCG